MKHLPLISSFCSTPRRKLYMAIAAQMILSAGAQAAPNGGNVVGGDGIIEQSGLDTTIIQNTDHLAIDWESFNIAAEERVQFIQPDADSVALNRILGNEASQIFGRLDANGHVILMNPNGVLFGEGASVNVGGLVASGLNINADDFMNGEYVLQAVDGKDGTVINNGIIKAATGGNVALIGKQVDNQGLISAKLGAVTLAAGKEAVLTFDNQGLLGVRVSKEILQDELGVNAAVTNSGDISAEGGRILMTGSVSQDIFSQAVNAEGLNAKTSVVMHEDGSFTLGAGADVVNTGTISTSSDTTDAGQIVLLGENINSSGGILANSKTANAAGNIEIHSRDTTLLTEQSQTSATNDVAGSGGQIKILGNRVGILDQSQVNTSGTNGGGDINIGGGFQGKELQLRNATRTVVGKDTLIEANAITEGDGGDVIVWADETTSFTGEIDVRGGELGGDGGFVEVSGKENLRFLGNVDRTALRGENGTLLLDPETVLIVPEDMAEQDDELSDGEILLADEPTLFMISDAAISNALSTGDVFIRANQTITANESGLRIAVDDSNNTGSLILESGGSVYFSGQVEIDLGAGDLIAVGSIDGLCETCLASDITLFNHGTINTSGNIYFLSSRHTTIVGANIGRNLEGEQTSIPDNIYLYGGDEAVLYLDTDLEVSGSVRMETLALPTLTSITLPSGATYDVPNLKVAVRERQGTIFDTDAVLGRKAEITVGEGIFISSDFTDGAGVNISDIILNASKADAELLINAQDAISLPEIGYDRFGNSSSNSISINVSSDSDISADWDIYTAGGSVALSAGNINFGESVAIDTTGIVGQGDISLNSVGDINLGQLSSGGDIEVRSAEGGIASSSALYVESNALFEAVTDIFLSEGFSLTALGDVRFFAEQISSSNFLVDDQVISASGGLSYETSGGTVALRGIYDAADLTITTNGGNLNGGQVDINVSGDVNINLGAGLFDWISGYMHVDAASFSAQGRELLMGDVIINTSTSNGTGDISLVASGGSSSYDIWLPTINPDGTYTTGNLLVQAPGNVVVQNTASGEPQFFGFSNLSGSSRFEVGGNLYLPEINANNPQGERDIDINVGGTFYQNYDVFTGGSNFTAIASEIVFADGVQINTDFSNPTQDAVFGNGNVSIQSTSDQAELVLPGITTQTDCVDTSTCGTLGVSAASLTNQGAIRVFGNADFNVVGDVNIRDFFSLESGEDVSLDNLFGGNLAVSARSAIIRSAETLNLGEWDILETASIPSGEQGSGFRVIANERLTIGETFIVAADYVEIKNSESRFGDLFLSAISADIEYSDDLVLTNAYLTGGLSGITSTIKVDGDLIVPEAGYIVGGFIETRPILEVDPASIALEVSGNISLLGNSNRLSSIQILNSQNVEIFNNGELTLDGVNAESLSLDILGDIEQTGALNILGATNINASFGASINLLDPLNDFNSLNVQAAGPAIINIADSGSISLADIDLNGASQGGALSVSASAISQEENGRILLQDSARLNLQAGYITLGSNGSATVDINGSVLNGVFTGDLNIQGLIRGAEGVAGTGLAGFFFNGSVNDNFVEVADGASITGEFRDGSKIFLGDGNDIVQFAGDVAVPIEGGSDQDTFGILLSNLSIAQIQGNEGSDILIGPDANNIWTVLANGEGTLSNGSAVSNFGGFETIQGGNQTDDFIIETLNTALQIDGGDGVDSLSANLNDQSINNQWLVDGVNSGSLNEFVLFTSIENLIGNDGADTVSFAESAQIGDISTGLGDDVFTLAADVTTGLLDAGEGQDILNLNGLNSIYTYLAERIGGDGDYTEINFEIENNEGGSKTIVGVDGYDAEWIIDSDGSVTISASQSGTTETNRFTGVTRVEGASGNDTFILQGGYLTDSIVGGQGGNDSLVADTGLANTWLLDGTNSGKVQVVETDLEQVFEAINNLVGGSDNDVFNILGGADFDGTISGGEGANSLVVLDPATSNVWTIASTNNLVTELAGAPISEIEFSEIQTLVGSEGRDTLILPEAGQVDLLNSTANSYSVALIDHYISIDGTIDGTDFDSTWILDQDGSISFSDASGSDQVINFSNFTTFRGGLGRDQFVVQGSWVNDDVWVYGDKVAGAVVDGEDSFRIDIETANATWYFSTNPVKVYLNGIDNSNLVNLSRDEAQNALLESTANVFNLSGIKSFVGSTGSDAFFVLGDSAIYGDSDAFDPIIDGSGGENYLMGFNYGAPEDLVWRVTEDFGGRINEGVFFNNIAHLKSNEFLDLNNYQQLRSTFTVADGVRIGSLTADSRGSEFNVGSESIVESIIGGIGSDTINASNAANVWQLSSTGGFVNGNNFSGIEQLNGGTAEDDFFLSSSSSEITQINGGAGENSLTAFNQDNFWALSASDSSLNEIQFNNITNLVGNASVDTFIVAGGGLTLNIDGGDGIDELTGLDQLNSWLVDGTYSGTLNEAIVFTDVEDLQGGALADEFTVADGSSVGQIAGGDGDDIISIGAGASAIYILGEAGSDRVELGDLVNITGYLDGGEGDLDILDISAFTGAFEFDFSTETTNTGLTYSNFEQEVLPVSGTSFFGGDGNTRWTFAEDNSFLIEKLDENGEVVKSGSYSNYNTVRGGVGVNAFVMSSDANFDGAIRGDASGNNSLTAADLVNLWIIKGQNQGQLQVDGAAEVTLFSNIANLIGGARTDSFEIATGGSITGLIDGGAGSDQLVITDAAATNDWLLAAQNSVGVVAQFRGIEALVGNANNDSFVFTDQTDVTSIEGGDGENTVLWSAGDVAVNLGEQSINEAIIFSGITSFNADPENSNSLTGADQVNTWILDNTNSGTVNSISFSGFNQLRGGNDEDTLQGTDADNRWLNLDATDNALNDVLVFSGMEKLIGGAGSDEFSAELVGVTAIDGGLGTNQLVSTGAVNNEWSIGGSNSGSFNTNLVFEGIQNLVGNAGNDTFTFAANSSIGNINSGAGEDTFILANNITAGILDGGDGLDILDRGGLNSIVTYLREVIGGDAVYTAANIETETSSGGSTTVVGVDGYSAEWRITGDGAVSVTATDADGVAVTNEFTGVTRAEGGAGFDAFVLLEEGAIADGIIGNGNDYLQATETTNIWTIDAADGGELAVQEYGTRLLFQGIANLYGGNGSDLFEVTAGGSVSGSIYGGGGVDTLAIIDTTVTNNWQLGETNVVGLVADFREIETLIGNDNNDTFTFNGPTAVTFIDGEAGDNAVIWQMADVAINLGTSQINELINFAGINSFDADSAFENTLIGADESNAWTLNGAASGAVTNTQGEFAFNGFENLVGGAMADAFMLTAEATGFVSINGEAGADSLTAADQLNQWILDAEGGELNGLRFANMEALTGGALQDNFVLADAAPQAQIIDGGAGTNRLTAYDQVNVWNVSGDNAGDVTGLASFRNIQTLIGGAQADTFTLAAGVNLSEIYAGAGNDLFVIGAGVVADNFYGEAGDDSVEVEVGLELSGVLDGGSGGETDGDYINLSKYTLLDATAELESVLGFAFLNFERIDEPNTQGVYFGGNGTNFWYITGANEGRLEIRDGEDAGVYEFSGVHSLMGGEGEDIFIFANDAAAVSTLIDGGEGSGANTLDLSAQGLINEWLLSGADSGSVSNASNTSGNIFTNIAYLIGGSSQDVFDLQTGGSIAGAIDGGLGGDELRISVEQTSNWQLGGVAGHSVTGIASFANIESLIGGAGVDNFDILAELADVTQLNGGAGSDAVNFLYEAPVTVDLANGLAAGLRVESVERFTAADARSIFTGVESAATWAVDGTDQGSIQYLRPADGNLINVAFDGFGNLIGGAGDDQIVVAQGGSISGTLSGGDGRNSVDLQDVPGDIHVAVSPEVTIANGLARMTLADVDQLIGNGRTWLYGASDRSYTWTIDGLRSGQMTSTLVDDSNRLLAFENLSAIRGGTHDDIFQVIAESPLLSLDGGSAVTADLVDYSRVNGNLRISLADALTGQNGELTGVEGIRGNNAGPESLHSAELVGPDSGAIWTIGGPASDGLADGVNDGRVAFDEQTITFVDFNMLTGGAGVDTFNQASGVVLGTLNGGAGDDVFNVDLVGANAGTAVIGGAGTDSLVLRGGDEAGLMTYTAAAGGGEFDYSLAEVHYKVSHEGVEGLRDRTLAASLDVRGSSAAETFSLANGRFWVNGGDVVEYGNKRDIAVRSGINDIIEVAGNLVVENSLTLANGTVIANDPTNNSIATAELILDSTRDVGLSSARLRTSVDNLLVRNSAGDIYLQEQNGVNLAEFNANGVFDLRLLNGDLTNSASLTAADVVRIVAENGDVTLVGANQLRDDVAVSGSRVELHNASTLTLVEVNAEDLYLRTQRGIEGDGQITVAGLTEIDAGGDVLMDFATNDFNQLRVTNAVNLTVVDQNAIELLDINASGAVVVRSTNTVTLNDNVTGANGVDVSSGTGSINQNGSISTNNGSVVVSAGNGEVNLGEDAKIVSNGGSVNINAGAGNVNMGGDTRIAANGGDVNIVAADSVVVAEVVSSGNVNINAGSGSVSDGNGGATNVSAGGLQSSSNTGFGDDDALETNVGNIDITTNTGNVAVSNSGNVTVDKVSTGQGDISLVNQGDVELGGGSVVAENGANGGSVNIDVSQGSVSQSGPTSVPAVKGGGVVVINAPDGAIGEGGGLRVDAPFVEIIAAIKAGDIFVNPGADKIEYFSGSFKFDDQLLAVEPLEDINPAIFANVKSYFFNDISLLLPRDQLYEEDEEE